MTVAATSTSKPRAVDIFPPCLFQLGWMPDLKVVLAPAITTSSQRAGSHGIARTRISGVGLIPSATLLGHELNVGIRSRGPRAT